MENEHELLTLHCPECMGDTMTVQLSEEHGMAIGCKECHVPVIAIDSAEAFELLVLKSRKQGCTLEHEHDHGKN